jgi:hypothetical protein
MLTRNPSADAKLLRQAENSRRYRKRQGPKGKRPWVSKWVLRSTVPVADFIDWLIDEGYLTEDALHMSDDALRPVLDDALTRYIADKIRHR